MAPFSRVVLVTRLGAIGSGLQKTSGRRGAAEHHNTTETDIYDGLSLIAFAGGIAAALWPRFLPSFIPFCRWADVAVGGDGGRVLTLGPQLARQAKVLLLPTLDHSC